MSTQHLYFLRHAEGLHNARLPHGPTADIPLTDAGFQTVSTIAAKIADANFIHPPEAILVSPLLRTVQTAEGLKPLYPHVLFELDPSLIEWANFDVPAGTLMSTADKQPLIDALWDRCDPHWVANDLGESFHACITRTRDVHRKLFNDARDSIICVSHGHFMQTFILNLMQQIDATPDGMRESRTYEKLGNLDIVHVAHDRDTGHIAIAHHKFVENYSQAHAYPVKRALTKHDEIVLT